MARWWQSIVRSGKQQPCQASSSSHVCMTATGSHHATQHPCSMTCSGVFWSGPCLPKPTYHDSFTAQSMLSVLPSDMLPRICGQQSDQWGSRRLTALNGQMQAWHMGSAAWHMAAAAISTGRSAVCALPLQCGWQGVGYSRAGCSASRCRSQEHALQSPET
jgi:hypothetical protein